MLLFTKKHTLAFINNSPHQYKADSFYRLLNFAKIYFVRGVLSTKTFVGLHSLPQRQL